MSQPRTPRTDDSLERTQYFPEQILSPSDLAQDRTYLLHRLRRHNRLLHGWGIVLGFTVEALPANDVVAAEKPKKCRTPASGTSPLPPDVKPGDGTWLVVQPGYAVTPLGDEIYLPDPIYLNTSEELDGALVAIPAECCSHTSPCKVDPKGKTFYLIIEAFESESRPVSAANTRCGDHPEHFEFSRIRDTLRFRLIEKPVQPYADDNDRRKLLTGNPDRDYLSLGTITFPNGSAPVYSDHHRDPSLGPAESQTPSQSHPPADVLGKLLSDNPSTDHLQDAFTTIEKDKQQLVDGFRVCLRPAGLKQLFNGLRPEAALRKVSASDLMYGEPNEQLDRFFHRLRLSVSGLLEHDRIPYFIGVQKASPNDNEKRLGQLLEKAWRAATVTCQLARQWPSSHLPSGI